MFKFTTACAVIAAAASAAQQRYYAPQGVQQQLNYYQQAPQQRTLYQEPRYGSYQQQSYGFPWVRRSTIRPRDVVAQMPTLVDNYWKTAPKVEETIIASCEFDFLGYSYSMGRIELKQKPGDLTSMIGEFEHIEPGLHALKIHEYGDLEYGCESTGDVFNPYGAPWGHSHLDIHDRRVGDIEQLQARWDKGAEYKNRDLLVNLSGPNSVIGRSMVLYEREDDHDRTEHPATESRPAIVREGMGRRIGCCVIGLAQGEKQTHQRY
jgi:Cu-Zn family superoxide dismutase